MSSTGKETYLYRWITGLAIDKFKKADRLIPRIGYVVVIVDT